MARMIRSEHWGGAGRSQRALSDTVFSHTILVRKKRIINLLLLFFFTNQGEVFTAHNMRQIDSAQQKGKATNRALPRISPSTIVALFIKHRSHHPFETHDLTHLKAQNPTTNLPHC